MIPQGDRVLLRCFKRFRTATADGDPDTLFHAEFCDRLGNPDLNMSVYEVDASHWLEAFMCHKAAAGNDPPRHASAVDVALLCAKSVAVPVEDCPFASLSDRHHEVDFEDEAQLREFVKALVDAIAQNRTRVFEADKAEVTAWLKARRRARDSSWLAFLSGADRWSKVAGTDTAPPPAG